MKRRNFIKVMGASFISAPHIPYASINSTQEPEFASEFCRTVDYCKKSGGDYSTGFRSLDDYISFDKGDLVAVAARPSIGKSIFVSSIVQNILRQNKINIGYFNENSEINFYRKLLISQGKLKINDAHYFSIEDMLITNKLGYSISEIHLSNSKIILNSIRSPTLDEVISGVNYFVHKHKVKILVIDSLDNIYVKENNYNEVIPFLKKLAVNLDIPIIVTSGLNRNLENRSDKYPRLTDLDNYRVFDTYADTLIYLYRDCVYNEDCMDKKEVSIIIDKSKTGITATTRLYLDSDYLRLVEFNHDLDSL